MWPRSPRTVRSGTTRWTTRHTACSPGPWPRPTPTLRFEPSSGASPPSSLGHRSTPTAVEGGVEDLQPPVEQCFVERIGIVQPAVRFDDLSRRGEVRRGAARPEVVELERVGVPIDAGKRVEVAVEARILRDLAREAREELGDLDPVGEIATSVSGWARATHRSTAERRRAGRRARRAALVRRPTAASRPGRPLRCR